MLEPGQTDRIVGRRWTVSSKSPPLEGLDAAVPVDVGQPISVSEVLENPHKLVALSARYLAKAHPQDGLVSAPRRSCLDVHVSPDSLDRALRILDALLKAIEAAGLRIEIVLVEDEEPTQPSYYYQRTQREPSPPSRVTRVLCDEEWIEFCLTEKVRRIEGPPATETDRSISSWLPRASTYEPTGELALHLTNVEGLGIRSKWQDGKRQRLEDCLETFIANLSTVALAFRLKREEDERRAAEAREAARVRHEEEARRLEEGERRRQEELREKALEAEVAQWRRAEDIRSYVTATLESLGEEDAATDDGESVRKRMQWALDYADRIDPLTTPSS
jgi:hypothetical protein